MKFFALILCFSIAFALPQRGTKKVLVENMRGRIINGEQALQGQFPWQVGLNIVTSSRTTFCGGSIISDQWILTAGHCVDEVLEVEAFAGSIKVRDGQSASASDIIQHEQYNPLRLENDLGLVKVEKPWTFDENIQAVAVNYNDVVGVGEQVTISGWGFTSDSASAVSSLLNYVTLTTIDNADCEKEYNIIYNGVLCANSGDSPKVLSACGGDSGSPLVNSNNEQVGIVSFGHRDGCEMGHAVGFTRTSYFESWIKNKTQI